ncbi:hypothetical protein [Luteibacter yeojuensis]|uniref:Uncharacterized protein n=1 Tax=Luteibacter yeojuensis TaxID=345309 RepID=A0A0F3KGC3_9GAMM|nr:hypothetical protein [Luteibacter yeojuensis]KJV30305.1 hypothetical protein VI08_15190 [Luteibacter yeojuensis]
MRTTAALLAVLVPLAAWSQEVTLPNLTAIEAGEAVGMAYQGCDIPDATIKAFVAKLDTLVPGTTRSAAYTEGLQHGRAVVTKILGNGGDFTEFHATTCNEVRNNMARVMAARAG